MGATKNATKSAAKKRIEEIPESQELDAKLEASDPEIQNYVAHLRAKYVAAKRKIAALQLLNEEKDIRIADLKAEIDALKRADRIKRILQFMEKEEQAQGEQQQPE